MTFLRSTIRTAHLGKALLLAGALLFSLYAVPTIYGSAMARLAVVRFRAQSTEHHLWNSRRILAFEHTLATPVATEGVLRVPRLGIEAPLLEGTSDLALNRGVGHVTGTARPGEPGNLAIAGHRDGFFRALKDATPGDIIELQRPGLTSTSAVTDRYVVRNIHTVLPSDTTVLRPTPAHTLTLITCYPFYFVGAAPRRYIVQATLLPPTR